jgi:S-adenosylmethionine hydrolase
MGIITLLTDFGLDDTYVASVKGVILGINPQATIVDICHTVPPQDVREGAYQLGCAYRDFPLGTVHLAVVDPGVGSDRKAIALRADGYTFVGPDNGLFSYVLADLSVSTGNNSGNRRLVLRQAQDERIVSARGEPVEPRAPERPAGAAKAPGQSLAPVRLPRRMRAVELTDQHYWRQPVSQTFHGRDIFAPVAAHLSRGISLGRLGRTLRELLAFPLPAPERLPDGGMRGEVIHVDRFGNLVTNLRPENLPPGGEPVFTLTPTLSLLGRGRKPVTVRWLSASYADAASDLLAVVGSSGRIEIAVRNGSAAGQLGAGRGTRVEVETRAHSWRDT